MPVTYAGEKPLTDNISKSAQNEIGFILSYIYICDVFRKHQLRYQNLMHFVCIKLSIVMKL